VKIEYYKSLVCPRCLTVTRALGELVEQHPETLLAVDLAARAER
jgi:predicted DsbA family dithiol-disulfide isomerase